MTTPSGLWAEGDSLSPTNLNSRNPVGNFPSRTYHVAWAAGTGTTQINNAITNAVAGGYSYLFIDKSRLPYDASAIAFNNNLQMIREGGPPPTSGFDLDAYGDTSTDAKYAWAGVLAAVPASGGKIILQPGRNYRSSQPILINKGYTKIAGSHRGLSILSGTFPYGPILVFGSSTDTFPIGASLATGSGSSFAPSSMVRWLELRDETALMELNGLPAFTAELFVKYAATDSGAVIQSGGRWCGEDPYTRAFYIGTSGGNWSWGITTSVTGATGVRGTATAFSTGVVYHVAISYDGATARFFVNGTQIDSVAMTGTISQNVAEDIVVGGGANAQTPTASWDFGLAGGNGTLLDSIRISKTARYTSGFTAPTAKFTSDTNTLILCNFDLQNGPMTRANTKDGDCWLVCRNSNGVNFDAASGSALDNVLIEGNGFRSGIVFAPGNTYNFSMNRVWLNSCRVGLSITPGSNHYGARWGEILVVNSSAQRYGVVVAPNTGLLHIDVLYMSGAAVPLVIQSGGLTVTSAFISCQSDSVLGLLIQDIGSPMDNTFNSLSISTEAGVNAGWRAAMLLIGGKISTTFNSAGLETSGSKAPILIDKTGPIVFNALYTNLSGPPPSLVARLTGGAPVRPVLFNGMPVFNTGWIPLTDQAGDALVAGLGTLSSSSTGGTIRFDTAALTAWDLTLTSDVTQSSWLSISYGQPVSGAIKMDSTGSRLFVWPTNSKGTATLSYGSAAVNTFTGFYDGVNVILTSVRTGL